VTNGRNLRVGYGGFREREGEEEREEVE